MQRKDDANYQIRQLRNGMRVLFRIAGNHRYYLGDAYLDTLTGEWVSLVLSSSPVNIPRTKYARSHIKRSIASARTIVYRGESEQDALNALWRERQAAWQERQQMLQLLTAQE